SSVFIRRGLRTSLAYALPLSAIFVVWFLAFGHKGYSRHAGVVDTLRFTVANLWTTIQAIGHFPAVGAAIAVLLVIGWWIALTPLASRAGPWWSSPLSDVSQETSRKREATGRVDKVWSLLGRVDGVDNHDPRPKSPRCLAAPIALLFGAIIFLLITGIGRGTARPGAS